MIGKTVSQYRILSKLGEGGMGAVYLAQDLKLDRKVALKFLPPEIASEPHRLRRFLQEAKAVAVLEHPNVAHIFEIGEIDGTHFIAMQYVEGQTLRDRIGNRPQPIRDILDFGIQIADALDAAHNKNIIHRDIKADNIIVTPRSQVKVLDFGLAKVSAMEGGGNANTISRTESGVILGTVPNMSPEQASGVAVDHRSDIFSLGIVLYQMATGHLPFTGENASEVLLKIIQSQPDAISRFNYDIPPELDRIIRKCLEKEPDRRYQTARDLMVDLKNLQRDVASGATVALPVRASFARKLTPVLIAILAAAVIGMSLYTYLHNRKAGSIQSIAVLPFVNVAQDPQFEYLTDGITESTINSLSQLNRLRVMARSTVFAYKGKQVDPRDVGRDLHVDAVVSGNILRQQNRLIIRADLVSADGVQIWGQQYTKDATDLLSLQSEIASDISENLRLKLTGQEHEKVARRFTQDSEAYQSFLKGRYYWNKFDPASLLRATQYYREAIERDPAYALAYSGLADCFGVMSVNGWIAPDGYAKSKIAAQKALDLDPELSDAHSSMAAVLFMHDWNWKDGEKQLKRSIELNTNNSNAYDLYSYLLAATGRIPEAIEQVNKAQALNPLSLMILTDRAWIYYLGGQYDEAERQIQKAIELDEHFPGSYEYLTFVDIQMGRKAQAVLNAEKAVAATQRSSIEMATLGYALAVSGNKEKATAILNELSKRGPEQYVSPYYLGLIHLGLGNKDAAFQFLQKATEDHTGDWGILFMKTDPKFDPLRSDARFASILRQMNLQ